MAVKTQLDINDNDTSLVDVPLFATVDEAVKDIQLNDSSIKIEIQKEEEEK